MDVRKQLTKVLNYIDSLPKDEARTIALDDKDNVLFDNLSGFEYEVEDTKYFTEYHTKALKPLQNEVGRLFTQWYRRESTQKHLDFTRNSERDPIRRFLDVIAGRACIKNWEKTKQVYFIDGSLCKKLENTEIDEYDSSYFKNIPYDTIYVQLGATWGSYPAIMGFFVHINKNEHFTVDKGNTISIYFVMTKNDSGDVEDNVFPVMAENITYKDTQQSYVSMTGLTTLEENKDLKDEAIGLYSFVLNCLMFISAGNSATTREVVKHKRTQVNKQGRKIKKELNVNLDTVYVKTKYYGNKTDSKSEYQGGTHKSPIPHPRKGHWHKHWVGPKDNQELVPMWHEPIWVCGNAEDINVITNNLPTTSFKEQFNG